jgi:hypothetical protein
MSQRRFRAVPTASAPRSMAIGVTLQPVASGGLSEAQRATLAAELAAEADAQCKAPATMRWRFYPDFTEAFNSTVDPEADPPEWPYDFLCYPTTAGILSPVEITADNAEGDYANWEPDAITVTLGELGGPNLPGLLLIDFLDADGKVYRCRDNANKGCTDADGNTAAVVWSVRFAQFEAGYGERSIPFVHPDSDNRLVVAVRDIDTYVPGVLTITATDNFTAGGPYTFGPLTITYGSPPA